MNARIARTQPTGGKSLVSTGNAKVMDYKDCEILLSYGTPVAVKLYKDFGAEGVYVPKGTYRTSTKFSVTTTQHLARWNVSRAELAPQYVLETIYETVRRN